MLASIVARTRGVKNLLASLAPNAPRRSPRLGSRRCRLHRVEFVASPSSAYSQLVASVMPLRSNALATARDSPSVSRQHFRYPASARSLRRCRVRRMCSVFTLARSLTPVAIRATARNQLGRRSQVLSVTRQPCSVATMPYCQREIGPYIESENPTGIGVGNGARRGPAPSTVFVATDKHRSLANIVAFAQLHRHHFLGQRGQCRQISDQPVYQVGIGVDLNGDRHRRPIRVWHPAIIARWAGRSRWAPPRADARRSGTSGYLRRRRRH